MSDLRELYQEVILDHSRRPKNVGVLPGADHTAEGYNPLCGDKLRIYFEIDDSGRIADAGFEGSGCAISVASASLLTDTVIGLDTDAALAYFSTIVTRLAGTQADDAAAVDFDLGKLRALEGVKEFPSRVKFATLAWHALRSAINDQQQPVSTE